MDFNEKEMPNQVPQLQPRPNKRYMVPKDQRTDLEDRIKSILSDGPIVLTNKEKYILVSEITKQLMEMEGDK
jgi:hypothetical protein